MQPAAAPAPARHVISRQQRRWLERHGAQRHCSTCSRVISMNAENPQCGECRQKGEAFRARAAAAGLLLPE
jgi:Zn finger protein HypA/HybF involved in hydrogenase expression